MKLTKTPAQHSDYNLKLTKDELLALGGVYDAKLGTGETIDLLFNMIDKEIEKLGGR